MAEVDTSSYQKPAALPVQKSVVEQMGQYQALERGNTALSAEKLRLINDQFQLMNNELSNLAAGNFTKEQAAERLTNFANTYKFPAEVTSHMIDELQAAPNVKTFADFALRRGMDNNTKINQTYGTATDKQSGQKIYSGVDLPTSQGGGFAPRTEMAVQPPPTTPIQGPGGQPGIVGAAGPDAVLPVPRPRPNGMPVTPPLAPVASGATGATVNNGTEFNNRFSQAFPNAVATGPAPGTAAAVQAVNEQSGKDYAADLQRAKNYRADLYPSERVLDIVKEQGPNAFGPGTEGLNTLKSALVTWLPGVDQKLIDGVSNYEQAKKYLVQAARSNGATGTNDQLAAAFEANPNVKMSGATIENVVKSNIALRKMQHAQTLLFDQQGLKPADYSKWISTNQNVLDPRAFGFDMMTNEAKTKLLEGMATKDNAGNWIAKKGKEKEFKKFENSLGFANDAGLIEPPGRR